MRLQKYGTWLRGDSLKCESSKQDFSTSLHDRISRIKKPYQPHKEAVCAATNARHLTCHACSYGTLETVPDLVGFAAANGQEGKPRTKFAPNSGIKITEAHLSLDYLHRRVDRTCSALRSFAFRHRPLVEVTENHVRSDAILLTATVGVSRGFDNSMASRLTSFPFQGIFKDRPRRSKTFAGNEGLISVF
jgi:hypothetical protein